MVRIVCISDTHTYHKSIQLPPGDILLHAGDATYHGYEHEVRGFGEWMRSLPYMYKVYVAGNHDTSFEDSARIAKMWLFDGSNLDDLNGKDGLHYLQDEQLVLNVDGEEIKIYGSPWQPFFCNWAFNLRTPEELKAKWDLIPKGTDILITHGPPYKLNDMTAYGNEHVGCRELRKAIQRVRPKLHVCGHIHEGYGVSRWGDTLIANASSCTHRYNPVNAPLVFEFKDGKMHKTS
jgi:predicted phosphodiesterase